MNSKWVLSLIKRVIPGAKNAIESKIKKTVDSIQKQMVPVVPGEKKYLVLPPNASSRKHVRSELQKYAHMGHVDWQNGKVSGTIYHGGEDLNGIITEAYGMFSLSNVILLCIIQFDVY